MILAIGGAAARETVPAMAADDRKAVFMAGRGLGRPARVALFAAEVAFFSSLRCFFIEA
jgi:hypothetical protein